MTTKKIILILSNLPDKPLPCAAVLGSLHDCLTAALEQFVTNNPDVTISDPVVGDVRGPKEAKAAQAQVAAPLRRA